LWEYFSGSMQRLRVIRWAAAAALWITVPAPAEAEEHPLIEGARLAADRTEFERARAMLDELPETLGLDVADLRAALLLRADLSYALGDIEAMERDLALVARFTTPDELPTDVPPALRDRIGAHQGAGVPVALEARAERRGERVRVALRHSPPDALVRRARLFTRGAGDAPWVERELTGGGAAEEVELPADECRELYAELIGLGGAVLARRGDQDEPLVVTGAPTRRRVPAWPFVVAAAVVASGLVVGLTVGLTVGEEPDVQVGAPDVSW
jgi:hypothetical protein